MVEQSWDRLWPQLALRDDFWLGYLFCSDLTVVNALVKRADDYARLRVKGTQLRTVRDPDGLPEALNWLLSDLDEDLVLLARGQPLTGLAARGRSQWIGHDRQPPEE